MNYAQENSSLASLRAGIATIEQRGIARGGAEALCFGVAPVDDVLGGGLPRGCIHEASGPGADSFVAVLANRPGGAVLWCVNREARTTLYPPGLAGLGIDPARFVIVRCPDRTRMLWAVEEGLRSGAPDAVVAEIDGHVDLTAGRRLQLAAEAGNAIGFLLPRSWETRQVTSGVVHTRWRVEAVAHSITDQTIKDQAPDNTWEIRSGKVRWHATLERCRGGGTGTWRIEWNAKTYCFSLVTGAFDRPTQPAASRPMAG